MNRRGFFGWGGAAVSMVTGIASCVPAPAGARGQMPALGSDYGREPWPCTYVPPAPFLVEGALRGWSRWSDLSEVAVEEGLILLAKDAAGPLGRLHVTRRVWVFVAPDLWSVGAKLVERWAELRAQCFDAVPHFSLEIEASLPMSCWGVMDVRGRCYYQEGT